MGDAQRSCVGKHRHASMAKARAHIRSHARDFHGDRVSAYACRFCGGFHVGHSRRRPRFPEPDVRAALLAFEDDQDEADAS